MFDILRVASNYAAVLVATDNLLDTDLFPDCWYAGYTNDLESAIRIQLGRVDNRYAIAMQSV